MLISSCCVNKLLANPGADSGLVFPDRDVTGLLIVLSATVACGNDLRPSSPEGRIITNNIMLQSNKTETRNQVLCLEIILLLSLEVVTGHFKVHPCGGGACY